MSKMKRRAEAMNNRGPASIEPDEELHLGWHDRKKKSPLLINFRTACHHGAILAGSGAGKSTILGRIVEELLLRTDANVVIIDSNGDFRKAHIVADSGGKEGAVWNDGKRPPADIYYDREPFTTRWRGQEKIHLRFGPNDELMDGAKSAAPLLSWTALPVQWQMDILGLDRGRDPHEVAALYRVTERLTDGGPLGYPISPKTIREEIVSLPASSGPVDSLRESTITTALGNRFQQAADLKIWRETLDSPDLFHWFKDPLTRHTKRPRLCVLDVPSISDPTARNILIAWLLKILWDVVQKDWEDAVDERVNKRRPPTFLVVDEGHNFVPAEDPVDPHALRISQSLQRIAAEGRKYSFFLLLATQRPSKVRPGFLSECENVCLLRLRSPIERRLAVETWSLDRKHKRQSPRLATFQKGEGLLCGYWANWNEILFHGGLRRTKATGGDPPADWILKRAARP
jgi:hypothetical protein